MLQSVSIEVGVFESDDPEKLMIARVHEFGVQIDVTDAMRGYLAAIGYPLKKETKQINIPERSYLRSTFDEQEKEWNELVAKGLTKVLEGKITVRKMLDQLGLAMASDVQTTMRDLKEPPNSDMTKERKGSSNPLINEGARDGLISKVTYKLVGI